MLFELAKLPPREGYKLLSATVVPRPIAWVVSSSPQGQLNAAPFSFFNLFSDDPPVVCVGIMGRNGGFKDTAVNIQATREFVINLVPQRLAHKMNETAAEHDYGINELEQAGLSTAPSSLVHVPRIAESPVALECVPIHFLELGGGRVVIAAKVLALQIDDAAVLDAERCYVNTPVLDLVGRMHGAGEFALTRERFRMDRPIVPATPTDREH
ncbi:TPA: flavin reductase family protein [Pseudomonas aeruginosa]|nr:flavin reductase family protein [Pseudomonas aeruginosa]HEJ6151361.1 flavin reductase family protein [Pseudomonas aeruginosa]